jgi:trimeric autotransporter adhesin
MKNFSTIIRSIAIAILFAGFTAEAQTISATTYPFTNTTGIALESMSAGATQLLGSGVDNAASAVTNIGFDFWFNGIRYSQFSVNDNGLIKLGSAAITNESVNAMASATNLPKIAPYWDDLATGTTGSVLYKVVGTAPNRKLVVQWFVTLPKNNLVAANATFQAWLYESTGLIEFVYDSGVPGIPANPAFYSVGIGSSSTVFASIRTDFPFATYGTANDINTTALSDGWKYSFTPIIPTAPTTLTFTGVTIQSMTLNWVNTASNSVGNVIYYSTDGGVTYNFLAQTPASAASITATGLNAGILYYFKVYAVSEGGLSVALAGSQSTVSPTISGTKTIGPTGDYSSLTAAIAAIQTAALSGPTILELQSTYVSTVETFPIRLAALSTTPANTLTIRPATGANGLVISSSVVDSAIVFDGAKYVTLDGKPGGGTAGRDLVNNLTIKNTLITPVYSASGVSTVLLQNDATNNLIVSCNLTGVTSSAAGGVVCFGGTTGTAGNTSNVIDNCNILDGAAAGVSNGIYSAAGSITNKSNTVSNCNIYNFFGAANSFGIQLAAGNSGWTIQTNNLYQTVARTTGTGIQYGISISSGTGYLISGNYIGGSAAAAAGTPWTVGAGSGIGVKCINLALTGTNTIQNNTLTNFLMTTSNAVPWAGITLTAGDAVISGNIIGSTTLTGAIALASSTNASCTGISASPTSSVSITNNSIGGVFVSGTAITFSHSFTGISTTSGTCTIDNNTIGSPTVSGSIIAPTLSTSATAQNIKGIVNTSTGTIVITNNTIANLVNKYSNTTVAGQTIGIISSVGTNTITGNTVRNISNMAAGSATINSNAVIGISLTGTYQYGTQTLSQNTIHSLLNENTSAASVLCGIYYSGYQTTDIVERNFIHSLDMLTSNTATAAIYGLYESSPATIKNNIIRLGVKPDGTNQTTGYAIYGIYQGAAANYYFNSVWIGGIGVASAANSYAFYSYQSTPSCTIKNNIFVNARSNASGAGKNYIFFSTYFMQYMTLDNNMFFSSGTGAVFGRRYSTDYATLAAWKTGAPNNQDAHSGFADPNFINPTGSAALLNMHIASPTPIEGNGVDIPAVTNDFYGAVRSLFTPVDIGAECGNFTMVDIFPPVITYTALVNTNSTANRIVTATITDQSGVPTAPLDPLLPRIYFKKKFNGTWFSTPGVLASGLATNGTWTFTIDHSLVGGVVANDTIFYYVIAQDIATVPNINSLPVGVAASNVNTVITPPPTPNSYIILGFFSGTVSVGTTGANFTSLTGVGGLFSAINAGMLTGSLTVNIISDLTEPGTIALNSILTDGLGTYTVTINPNGGVARTISGPNTSTTALLPFNGASGVTIDGLNSGGNSLVISNTNASCPTVLFTNGSSNNTVTRATLNGASTAATSGVISLGTFSVSSACNNNTISNCIITSPTGTYNGIYVNGSSSLRATGNVIQNNTITNFKNAGIYIGQYYTNMTISNNQISEVTPQAASALFGMYFAYTGISIGTYNVFNNNIFNLNSTTASATIEGINSSSGIAGDAFNFYNNLIDLDAATTNATATIYGVFINTYANSTSNIYYNSIYIGGTAVTGGSSAGLYYTISYPVNFKNNVVFNARSNGTGTGKHYGIQTTGVTTAVFASNYNDIFVNGTGGVFATNGTDRQLLSDWVTATGNDKFSFSGNPGFTSATNLTPNVNDPNCFSLNGNGIPVAGFAVDYNGAARSTAISTGPTDIGAFEFTPATGVSPNSAIQLGLIQPGNITGYMVSGRMVATIQWVSGTVPTSIVLKYWSGVIPPGITGTHNGMGYIDVTQTGGTSFVYNITWNYSPSTINTISSEPGIAITKYDAPSWATYVSSVVDTTAKTVVLNALTSFSYFALTDRGLIAPLVVNAKVFLEGPFAGTAMTTALNTGALIPLTSQTPYPASTFGYTARTVASIPNATVVDWVLVELRSGTAAATKVFTQAGFLLNNGTIVDIDGVSPLNFSTVNAGLYYIVVRHRNHLAVMSAAPVALSGASALYDFTTAQTQAFGTIPMVALGANVFGMAAGSNMGIPLITTNDYNAVGLNLVKGGYYNCDHNMNGNVYVDDYNFVGTNMLMLSQVP